MKLSFSPLFYFREKKTKTVHIVQKQNSMYEIQYISLENNILMWSILFSKYSWKLGNSKYQYEDSTLQLHPFFKVFTTKTHKCIWLIIFLKWRLTVKSNNMRTAVIWIWISKIFTSSASLCFMLLLYEGGKKVILILHHIF